METFNDLADHILISMNVKNNILLKINAFFLQMSNKCPM